jgi:hypothetical protein
MRIWISEMTEACDLSAEHYLLHASRKWIERRQKVLLQSSGPNINLEDGWRLTLAHADPCGIRRTQDLIVMIRRIFEIYIASRPEQNMAQRSMPTHT